MKEFIENLASTKKAWLDSRVLSVGKQKNFEDVAQRTTQINLILNGAFQDTSKDESKNQAAAVTQFFGLMDRDAFNFQNIQPHQLKRLIISSDDNTIDGGLIAQNIRYYMELLDNIENQKLAALSEYDTEGELQAIALMPSGDDKSDRIAVFEEKNKINKEKTQKFSNASAQIKEQIKQLSKYQLICIGIWMENQNMLAKENPKNINPAEVEVLNVHINLHIHKNEIRVMRTVKNLITRASLPKKVSMDSAGTLLNSAVNRFQKSIQAAGYTKVQTSQSELSQRAALETDADNQKRLKKIDELTEGAKEINAHNPGSIEWYDQKIARERQLVELPAENLQKYDNDQGRFIEAQKKSETVQAPKNKTLAEIRREYRKNLVAKGTEQETLTNEAKLVSNLIDKLKPIQARLVFFGLEDRDVFDYVDISDDNLKILIVSSGTTKEVDGGLIAQSLEYYHQQYKDIEEKKSAPGVTEEKILEYNQQQDNIGIKIEELTRKQNIFCCILMQRAEEKNSENKDPDIQKFSRAVNEQYVKHTQAALSIHREVSGGYGVLSNAIKKFNVAIKGGVVTSFKKALGSDSHKILIDRQKILNDDKEDRLIFYANHYAKDKRYENADDLNFRQLVNLFIDVSNKRNVVKKLYDENEINLKLPRLGSKKLQEGLKPSLDALNEMVQKLDEKIQNQIKINKDIFLQNNFESKEITTFENARASVLPSNRLKTEEITAPAYQIIQKEANDILPNVSLPSLNEYSLDDWFSKMISMAGTNQRKSLEELKQIIKGENLDQYPESEEHNKALSQLALRLSKLYPDWEEHSNHVNKDKGVALLKAVLAKFVVPRFSGETEEFKQSYAGLIIYINRREKGKGQIIAKTKYSKTEAQVYRGETFDLNAKRINPDDVMVILTKALNDPLEYIFEEQIERAWNFLARIEDSKIVIQGATSLGQAIYEFAGNFDGSIPLDADRRAIILKYSDFVISKKLSGQAYTSFAKDADGNNVLTYLHDIASRRFNYLKNNASILSISDKSLFLQIKFSITATDINDHLESLNELSDLAMHACDLNSINQVINKKIHLYFTGDGKYSDYALSDAEVEFIKNNPQMIFVVDPSVNYLKGKYLLDDNLTIFIFQCNNDVLKSQYVVELLGKINAPGYQKIPLDLIRICIKQNSAACSQYLREELDGIVKNKKIPSNNFLALISEAKDPAMMVEFIDYCIENGIDPLINENLHININLNAELESTILESFIKNSNSSSYVYYHPELINKLKMSSYAWGQALSRILLLKITEYGLSKNDELRESQQSAILDIFNPPMSQGSKEESIKMLNAIAYIETQYINGSNAAITADRFPLEFYKKFRDNMDKIVSKDNPALNRLKNCIERVEAILNHKDNAFEMFNQNLNNNNMQAAAENYFDLLKKIETERNKENIKKRNAPASDNQSIDRSTLKPTNEVVGSLSYLERCRLRMEKEIMNRVQNHSITSNDVNHFNSALQSFNVDARQSIGLINKEEVRIKKALSTVKMLHQLKSKLEANEQDDQLITKLEFSKDQEITIVYLDSKIQEQERIINELDEKLTNTAASKHLWAIGKTADLRKKIVQLNEDISEIYDENDDAIILKVITKISQSADMVAAFELALHNKTYITFGDGSAAYLNLSIEKITQIARGLNNTDKFSCIIEIERIIQTLQRSGKPLDENQARLLVMHYLLVKSLEADTEFVYSNPQYMLNQTEFAWLLNVLTLKDLMLNGLGETVVPKEQVDLVQRNYETYLGADKSAEYTHFLNQYSFLEQDLTNTYDEYNAQQKGRRDSTRSVTAESVTTEANQFLDSTYTKRTIINQYGASPTNTVYKIEGTEDIDLEKTISIVFIQYGNSSLQTYETIVSNLSDYLVSIGKEEILVASTGNDNSSEPQMAQVQQKLMALNIDQKCDVNGEMTNKITGRLTSKDLIQKLGLDAINPAHQKLIGEIQAIKDNYKLGQIWSLARTEAATRLYGPVANIDEKQLEKLQKIINFESDNRPREGWRNLRKSGFQNAAKFASEQIDIQKAKQNISSPPSPGFGANTIN